MKLRFDQNLSAQLTTRLANLYPDSTHVKAVGLTTASSVEVGKIVILTRSPLSTPITFSDN